MYKDEMKVEPGNIYSKIIEQCSEEIKYIRDKVSIVTLHKVSIVTLHSDLEECSPETPARTPLERELRDILANLKDLKEKIII